MNRLLLILTLIVYPAMSQQSEESYKSDYYSNDLAFLSDDVTGSDDFMGADDEYIAQTEETKFFGDYFVDLDEVNNDKVRIVGGDLTVHGQVDGQFTVIGGDIYIKSTAIINGKIIAIGGSVHKDEGAQINGRIIETNLSQGLTYKDTGKDEGHGVKGETDFSLKERSWYSRRSWIHPKKNPFCHNRNEGLVITPFNFKWDRRSLSNLRLNLTAGWRFGQETIAGRITMEGYFLNRLLILYGSAFRESRTDDFYRLPDLENSLASILARQDFYDRWDEMGAEGGVGIDLPWIRIKASYVSAEVDSIPVHSDAWSLFHDNRILRNNLNIIPGNTESIRLTFAFKPRHYSAYENGIALYANYEEIVNTDAADTFKRGLGMAMLNLEITPGVVVRGRLLGGTSTGVLPEYRYFSVGGLGSIAGYPYKLQTGDQFVQLNGELVFAPDFIDSDIALILFGDTGNAWMRSEYELTDIDAIIENGKSSAGLGLAFDDDDETDIRINVSRPLDGRDTWETTIRINYNF